MLLSNVAASLASPSGKRELSPVTPAINHDERWQYLQKIRARLNFYSITINGGKAFITLSILMWVLALLAAPKKQINESER
ncbi:MAG: hypothetical protein D6719_00095 [Candidatus Dadabacteria bacterium]|nr:MAG: hypothetical protein D6719_00095 [Candidatus Dadabacteria bacterium]